MFKAVGFWVLFLLILMVFFVVVVVFWHYIYLILDLILLSLSILAYVLMNVLLFTFIKVIILNGICIYSLGLHLHWHALQSKIYFKETVSLYHVNKIIYDKIL